MTTPPLLNWMWQSTLCLAACWLFYRLLLRREACFGYNRGFLLLAPLLAAIAPLLPWAQWWPVAAAVRVVGVPRVVLPVLHVGAGVPAPAGPNWLLLLYAAGVVLSLLLLAWRIGCLLWLTRHLPGTPQLGYTLRLTGGRLPTSSFGRTVFWNDTIGFTPAEAAQVLAHELAHVRQGHTADQLWLQLWQAALWFNPLVYLLRRELALTHEYLADADALRHSTSLSAADYTRLLARQATQTWQAPALTHAFTTSHTLNRIAMLHRLPFTRAWRKWAALPAAALLLGLVACEQMESLGPPPPPPPPPAPAAPPVPPPPPAALGRVLEMAEEMPEYQGGMEQLMHDLGQLVKYPTAAREAQLEGKAFISFVVGADGTVHDVRLQKGVSTSQAKQGLADELNDAALRAVQSLPGRWTPGRQDGKPVSVAYTIPITFALN